MKRHMTVVAVAAQLLLASTFVLIESLSTRNLVAKTPSRTRFQSSSSSSRNDNKLVSSRHASSLSRIDVAFNSRLFSSSDMSSHPYSVYYGSSGSTAAQNFDQHDHANDVYGYGSRSHNDREGEGEQEGSHRNIQSVQDRSLVGGRRGAQLFGTNYIDTNNNNNIIYNNDPPPPPRPRHVEVNHGRSFIEEEDMYMDNLHMMDHRLDYLLNERDNLRRHIDDLVGNNIYLQQHPYHHYHSHHDTNLLPRPSIRNHRGEHQSTKDAIDDVMAELKNMQKMLQPLQPIESQQVLNHNNNNDKNVDAAYHNKAPTIEIVLTELRSMHKSIQNFGIEQQRQHQEQQQQRSLNSNIDNDVNTNNTNDSIRGGDASPHQSPPPPVHDIGGTQQPQHHNFEVTLKGSTTAENDFCSGNSISGEYVVVINAEIKHKTETITSSTEEQGGEIREIDEYHYPYTNYNGEDDQLGLDATSSTV